MTLCGAELTNFKEAEVAKKDRPAIVPQFKLKSLTTQGLPPKHGNKTARCTFAMKIAWV